MFTRMFTGFDLHSLAEGRFWDASGCKAFVFGMVWLVVVWGY